MSEDGYFLFGLGAISLVKLAALARMSTYQSSNTRGLEERSLEMGMKRVRYDAHWLGLPSILHFPPEHIKIVTQLKSQLALALWKMEKDGITPVLPDGKVGGNASAIVELNGKPHIILSKSGKLAGKKMDLDEDFVIVESFNTESWTGDYVSSDDQVLPSSDLPLHYATYRAGEKFNWSENPKVILHGHALASEEEAIQYNIPCSTEETLCSTPADTKALVDLLELYPYPLNKVFIRKNHGFLLLGSNVDGALKTYREKIKSHLNS